VRVKEITNVSVIFACRIVRETDGKVAAEGWTRHAFVDASGKLLRKGNDLADWMKSWSLMKNASRNDGRMEL
jgi:acyl-CoA thioesterase FadM